MAAEQGVEEEEIQSSTEEEVPQEVTSLKQKLAQTEIPERILDFTSSTGDLSRWIHGYCIALTLDAYSNYKEILERLPKMEFVWGGYRASYLFFEPLNNRFLLFVF